MYGFAGAVCCCLCSEHGTIVHTGDWKIDENPVDGEAFDRTTFDLLSKSSRVQGSVCLEPKLACQLDPAALPKLACASAFRVTLGLKWLLWGCNRYLSLP